jgi:hypothetical protein
MGASASISDVADLEREFVLLKPTLTPDQVTALQATFQQAASTKGEDELYVIEACRKALAHLTKSAPTAAPGDANQVEGFVNNDATSGEGAGELEQLPQIAGEGVAPTSTSDTITSPTSEEVSIPSRASTMKTSDCTAGAADNIADNAADNTADASSSSMPSSPSSKPSPISRGASNMNLKARMTELESRGARKTCTDWSAADMEDMDDPFADDSGENVTAKPGVPGEEKLKVKAAVPQF